MARQKTLSVRLSKELWERLGRNGKKTSEQLREDLLTLEALDGLVADGLGDQPLKVMLNLARTMKR